MNLFSIFDNILSNDKSRSVVSSAISAGSILGYKVRFCREIEKFAENTLPATIQEAHDYWITENVVVRISKFLTNLAHKKDSHFEDSFHTNGDQVLDISNNGNSIKVLWLILDVDNKVSPSDGKKIEKFVKAAFKKMKYLPCFDPKVYNMPSTSTVWPIVKIDAYNSREEAIDKGVIGAMKVRIDIKNIDVECNSDYIKVLCEYCIEQEPAQFTPLLDFMLRLAMY